MAVVFLLLTILGIIIAIIFGLLMYSRYTTEYAFLSRWPIAILIGSLLGVVTRAALETDIIGQITPMMTLPGDLDTIVVQVITVVTMIYFIFTFGHGRGGQRQPGWHRGLLYVGRVFLMVGMGAAFSNKFMGLLSYLIQRLYNILFGWQGLL